jgi:hypothetical protein
VARVSDLDTLMAMLDRAKIAYEHFAELKGGTILNIKGEHGLYTAFYFAAGGALESVDAIDGPYDDAGGSEPRAKSAEPARTARPDDPIALP